MTCTLTFSVDLDQDKMDASGFPAYASNLRYKISLLGLRELDRNTDPISLAFGCVPPIRLAEEKAQSLLHKATWIAYDDISARSCIFGFRHIPELRCRMDYRGEREITSKSTL